MGMQDQLDSPFYCSICGEISEAVNEDDVCPDCLEDVQFVNYYKCECGYEWEDIWSCTCDDKCPKCNTSNTPYRTEDYDGD